MATIQTAKANYARRTAAGASAYNAAKGRMSSNYAAGVSRFIGQPVSGQVVSAYQSGIANAQYVGGDPDKWERNYMAKMTQR